MEKGIDGIGLFRSEYLYMNRKNFPSENEQFHLIKDSLYGLKNKQLTIRTLDIGNDKQIESFEKLIHNSPNQALCLRAIRLTIAYPKIFEKQIIPQLHMMLIWPCLGCLSAGKFRRPFSFDSCPAGVFALLQNGFR